MTLGSNSSNLLWNGALTLTCSTTGFSNYGMPSRTSVRFARTPSSSFSIPLKPIAPTPRFATPAALTKPMKQKFAKTQKSLWLGSKPTANKGN